MARSAPDTTPASDPAVSILTAVRNGLPHLNSAVASIRAQTQQSWEWIVVDDGSTDGTAPCLAAWARREPRLHLITAPARGLVASLNAGLAACRAPLVARMDADDVARPERLAVQSAYLAAHPEIAAADGQVALIGGRRNAGMRAYVEWVNTHVTPEAIAADLFVESPLVHPAVIFRAATVRAVGGYREGDFPEDYDLWLRLHAAGHALGKAPAVVLDWRDSAGRLSRVDTRYRRQAFIALKQEHLLRLEGDALRGTGFVLAGAAPFARPWRQWLRRIGARPEFIVEVEPRRIGGRILGAAVVPLAELRTRAWRYLLVTVTGRAARESLRALLAEWGIDRAADRRVRYV
jgi:glycosyltransferase involved in cell wall biosynthesis